jgi:hypothetical protein
MNEKNFILARRSDRFRQMLDNGSSIVEEIKQDAEHLAEKMQRVHGGEWLTRIDHETGYVSVRQR